MPATLTTLIADANGDLYDTTASGSPSNAYVQTNLVSDIAGLATLTDPSLINPWGISRSPTSPFWVSNQGTSTSTLYAVTGGTNVVKVNVNPPPDAFVGIPTTKAGPQGPTGQVNNTNTASFQLTPGTPTTSSRFIFANLNGTISGWAGGQDSTVVATTPGAVYTGLAIDTAQDRLYAANSAAGRIDVFDSSFAPVSLPCAFTDPYLPAGFVPFNVQDIDGKVYVTYVPPGRAAEIAATPGQGVVDVFDENGGSLQRLVTGGPLAAPWGVALAPAGFGQFGGDLLVGNFSFVASEINAFDPLTGAFQGTIPIDVGAGNTPGGLWALEFGSGAGNGGDANTLYFNDGINGEANGLFAALEVPGQTITKGNGDFTLDIGSNSTVTLGNGDDTITGGHNNKLTIGKGDQSITLSGGNNTITLGRGDSTVSVGGGGNTINLGKGDNTVHGGSGDTINITRGTLSITGTNETVFLSPSRATINDFSTDLTLKIGPTAGKDTLTNFASDPGGVVDLLGGIGGYTSVPEVLSALKSDGHGGTLLSFESSHRHGAGHPSMRGPGHAGSLDFVGMAPSQLHASNFQIG